MSSLVAEGDSEFEVVSTDSDSASREVECEPSSNDCNANLKMLTICGDESILDERSFSVFPQVAYLGCTKVDERGNPDEVSRMMKILNEKAQEAVEVKLCIPNAPYGFVKLMDAKSNANIASYKLTHVTYSQRGSTGTTEANCFCFIYELGSGPDPLLAEAKSYQCHVFYADAALCGAVLGCFSSVFSKSGPSRTPLLVEPLEMLPEAGTHNAVAGAEEYMFDVFLELKEDDGKSYTVSPQEKNCFKLRRSRERKVTISLQQVQGPRSLAIQKCFGLLLAAGRNVRHSDMHLLDMHSMGRGNDDRTYIIEALWDPKSPNFEVLNTETPKDTRVFMTIAADVILSGIHEPVRFVIESKARIFHSHERFWYITRKPVVERYYVAIHKVTESQTQSLENDEAHQPRGDFEVVMFESATERDRRIAIPRGVGGLLSASRSPSKLPTNLVSPADEDDSDSDEPPLSGSGAVSQECPEDVLAVWGDLTSKWQKDPDHARPKEMGVLVRNGVPDALRGEVWLLLAGFDRDPEMNDTYRLLMAKDCPSESVILRDIHRTFPAHDFFKEAGGVGQDALYKLSKAYSLYDEEVGYCQGLSFLAAALLLHMPEEQAFCLLVKIMFDYNLRELFKQGFEALQLRFFQLERLIQDMIPDLHQHLNAINVEVHMFASQWFLTLFTAKFPLSMVFHIIDLFLSEGINTIFNISIALLKSSKKDLLQLDFEGVLKYFRVTLPRKYRSDANARELIMQAVKTKVSSKRLVKYEKEYIAWKQQEAESQDPMERLERENYRLKESVLRLERENDDLAHELVTSKIELRRQLDAAEDNIESLQKQVETLTVLKNEFEEENRRVSTESEQVKEMCRRELQQSDEETTRSQSIIKNYKQICTDLSNRLEKQQTSHVDERNHILKQLRECDNCAKKLANDDNSVWNDRLIKNSTKIEDLDVAAKLASQDDQIRSLELELAQTKLALVETQCRSQDLMHQLTAAESELVERKSTWLSKTKSSIREVAAKVSTSTGASNAVSQGAQPGMLNGGSFLPSNTNNNINYNSAGGKNAQIQSNFFVIDQRRGSGHDLPPAASVSYPSSLATSTSKTPERSSSQAAGSLSGADAASSKNASRGSVASGAS